MLVFLRAVLRGTRPRVRDTEVDLLKEREQIDVSSVLIEHHSRRADRVAEPRILRNKGRLIAASCPTSGSRFRPGSDDPKVASTFRTSA